MQVCEKHELTVSYVHASAHLAYLFDERVCFLGLIVLAVDGSLLVVKAELDLELLAKHSAGGYTSSTELGSE
jgi:hypothetical protein